MFDSLVPQKLLKKSDKILFVAHLALGDFTYLQNCFKAFSRNYPHIKMHLWVDEVRRTRNPAHWPHLSKYSLYDWLEECSLFDKIYKQTYSPALLKQSIVDAQRQEYPIVISLAVLQRHFYASLIRKISPNGFVVGMKKRVRLLDFRKHLAYRKLDEFIPAYRCTAEDANHISAIYAGWFRTLFGIAIPEIERFPFVHIPPHWLAEAREKFTKWGFCSNDRKLFLNAFSKSPERSWPLERMIELATEIRKIPEWEHSCFVVNVVPEEMESARKLFAGCTLGRIELFSAEENFFQLPAVLGLCTLIISVETAVMHLANAVHVPVIALMRRTNPEWTPIDSANSHIITVNSRKGWVKEITVDRVIDALPRLRVQEDMKHV